MAHPDRVRRIKSEAAKIVSILTLATCFAIPALGMVLNHPQSPGNSPTPVPGLVEEPTKQGDLELTVVTASPSPTQLFVATGTLTPTPTATETKTPTASATPRGVIGLPLLGKDSHQPHATATPTNEVTGDIKVQPDKARPPEITRTYESGAPKGNTPTSTPTLRPTASSTPSPTLTGISSFLR